MRKLHPKADEQSSGLKNVYSNQSNTNQLTKQKIIEAIEKAKGLDTEKNLQKLSEIIQSYVKDSYHSNPGPFSLEIKDVGEKAYQRAILSSTASLNTIGEIYWKDLELPVVLSEKRRRPCIDLIGSLTDGTPVLCELKFAPKEAKKLKDSPIYAAIELLIYYYLITLNCKDLQAAGVRHVNGKEFNWTHLTSSPLLIVGANDTYWNCWENEYQTRNIDIKAWKQKLPANVQLFSSEDFNFKEQRETERIRKGAANALYTPNVGDKVEWIERFI
jgi:hypothetical protein